MKAGYARVSTKEQTVDLQVDALKKAGCTTVCNIGKRLGGVLNGRVPLDNGTSISSLASERHFLRMPFHRAQRRRREQRSSYRNPMKAAFQRTVARVFSW